MMLGVVAAPGIALRLDDMGTAPGWVWIGLTGWLGIYVLYPAWAFALGSSLVGEGRAGAQASQRVDAKPAP